MAAIIPHLEQPQEASDIERAYNSCASSLNGPDLGEGHPVCPAPDAVVANAHAGLLTMVFVRQSGCRACWIAPHEVINYSLH